MNRSRETLGKSVHEGLISRTVNRTVSGMSTAFARYLTETKTPQSKIAKALGVREATVSAWKAGGRPRLHLALALERMTDGAVPVSSWVEDQEGAA